jgi:hypothetical protein
MPTLFTEQPYEEVLSGLDRIGYKGNRLERNYRFTDYFHPQRQPREIAAAAFGQTPLSYDSACIGIALVNGLREQALINSLRALGAPIILEIDNTEVREWAVSRNENEHALVAKHDVDRINQMIDNRGADWMPKQLLRDKNIGTFRYAPQLGLFAGLLPELEEHIQDQLEPLLHDALSSTKDAYRQSTGREADSDRLFKLIFWILTAKVFHDRRVNGFKLLGNDPDEILAAVAKRYEEPIPHPLLNKEARQVALNRIWSVFDSRNLSVEVLAHMWSNLLIDDEIRQGLSLHRTSRTIVRYIVDRIPFEDLGDDSLTVFEPCSGSAVFLIGAMNVLRPRLFGAPPLERHRYFTKHLEAVEAEIAGVEISRLALTLADFPHPGGWNVQWGDVFEDGELVGPLSRAGVVLCNPPFSEFTPQEREHYNIRSTHKPAELLHRVLDHLHPNGVLGFVLPQNAVDGRGYTEVRRRLAKRFANIEVNVLPDRAFEDADSEVALLVATEPIPHDTSRVISRKVNDNPTAWREFALKHIVSSDFSVKRTPKEVAETLTVPDLPEVWDFLRSYRTLGSVANIHRGLEWNLPLTTDGVETGNRALFVRSKPAKGFMEGLPPQASLNVFETPKTMYLSVREEDARGGAYKRPWRERKAIVNGYARSRQAWRLAAIPDTQGITCYQNHHGVWPKPNSGYDEWLLSAILNSPIANAFVATREGKTNITKQVLNRIPIPYFTERQKETLRQLIAEYRDIIDSMMVQARNPERLLMEIDALVLKSYNLHPKIETQLLKFFQGTSEDRPTRHSFGNYLPPDFDVYFSLSEYLSPRFQEATAGELRKRMGLA